MLSNKYSYIRAFDYEADDIITSLVSRLNDKVEKYILTIDADLLPLIDEYTSILLFRKNSQLDDVNKYVLFTKDNFERRIKDLKSFQARGITLNNFLLIKMLIGDKSDNIPRVAKHTSKNIVDFIKWTNLDKDFKWSYFLTNEEVSNELNKIILNKKEKEKVKIEVKKANKKAEDFVNKKEKEQALINFKLMKMNSSLGGRRNPFEVKKEMITKIGDHTIGKI